MCSFNKNICIVCGDGYKKKSMVNESEVWSRVRETLHKLIDKNTEDKDDLLLILKILTKNCNT